MAAKHHPVKPGSRFFSNRATVIIDPNDEVVDPLEAPKRCYKCRKVGHIRNECDKINANKNEITYEQLAKPVKERTAADFKKQGLKRNSSGEETKKEGSNTNNEMEEEISQEILTQKEEEQSIKDKINKSNEKLESIIFNLEQDNQNREEKNYMTDNKVLPYNLDNKEDEINIEKSEQPSKVQKTETANKIWSMDMEGNFLSPDNQIKQIHI